MKKIFTILFVAVCFIGNAQSLRIFSDDRTLANNDTIDVVVEGRDEIETYLGYENLTDQQVGFYVRKEIINYNPDNTTILFCIGMCYDGEMSALLEIGAGLTVATTDGNAFHSSYVGSGSPALVKYTFFNADDESDCVSFYINYTTGVGITQADLVKGLRASPNPASQQVAINYVTPDQESYLVIKNLTGKEVYRTRLESRSGKKFVSLSDFSAGVYFYGVEAKGKMVCTKKLLVK